MEHNKMNIAIKMLELMNIMSEDKEDISVILTEYNNIVECYNLPLAKYRLCSPDDATKFEVDK